MLVLFWCSAAAVSNTTTNKNGTFDEKFSCEWNDLKFPITYGPGIACGLSGLIGGFLIIFGKGCFGLFPSSFIETRSTLLESLFLFIPRERLISFPIKESAH